MKFIVFSIILISFLLSGCAPPQIHSSLIQGLSVKILMHRSMSRKQMRLGRMWKLPFPTQFMGLWVRN